MAVSSMRSGTSAERICGAALVVIAIGCAGPAHAETPAAFCKRVGTDDTTQPIPEALVPTVNATFGMKMSARVAVDTTVFRCDHGHVMVCTVGANLPCGKANTSREPGEGTLQWCHDNPAAEFVPAAATGHDTIYAWGCQGGAPRILRQPLHVDAGGFVAEFWKALR
jgi:hypothetical protein